MASESSSPWLTVPQAAAHAQLAPITILRAIRRRELRSTKIGRHHRVHLSWLDAWLGLRDEADWRDSIVEKSGPPETAR